MENIFSHGGKNDDKQVTFAYSSYNGKVNKPGEQTGNSGSIRKCTGETAVSSLCLLFTLLHGTSEPF